MGKNKKHHNSAQKRVDNNSKIEDKNDEVRPDKIPDQLENLKLDVQQQSKESNKISEKELSPAERKLLRQQEKARLEEEELLKSKSTAEKTKKKGNDRSEKSSNKKLQAQKKTGKEEEEGESNYQVTKGKPKESEITENSKFYKASEGATSAYGRHKNHNTNFENQPNVSADYYWNDDYKKQTSSYDIDGKNERRQGSRNDKCNQQYSRGNNKYQNKSKSTDFMQYEAFEQEWKRPNADINYGKVAEKFGDLFTAPKEYALAHCVAEDMSMGAGVAISFRKEFRGVGNLLNQKVKTGGVAVLTHDGRHIYYLVTKEKSQGKPTMQTLFSSLNELKNHMKTNDVKKLAIPQIGCGLDRLHWPDVKQMLEYVFKDEDVEIVVYILNDSERIRIMNKSRKIKRKKITRKNPYETEKSEEQIDALLKIICFFTILLLLNLYFLMLVPAPEIQFDLKINATEEDLNFIDKIINK